jgi:hypothetical protein
LRNSSSDRGFWKKATNSPVDVAFFNGFLQTADLDTLTVMDPFFIS